MIMKDNNTALKEAKTFRVLFFGREEGTITFQPDGSFTSTLAPQFMALIADTRRRLQKEGVKDLGEVIAKEPIKIQDAQLLPFLWQELKRIGIELRVP